MNLFFYFVNNNNMKIIFFIVMFLCSFEVSALSDIKINNESLSPAFDKNVSIYNFYTDEEEINVSVIGEENEVISGDGLYNLDGEVNEIIINSNLYGKYFINVYYKYDCNKERESYIKDINISGYDIDFKRDVYEYYIDLNDEEHLDISYELSNLNDRVIVSRNGNFNRNTNIIEIKLDDLVYRIIAYKSISVSYVESEEYTEISDIKKEIVTFVIVTISCILIFCFYYITFRDKTILNI